MLSTIITILLLCVMLSIIVSLVLGATRAHKRHARLVNAQAQTSGLQISAVLSALNTMPPDAQAPVHALALPASWYRRRRMLISGALLVMALLALFVQSGLADGAIQNISKGLGLNTSQQLASFDISTELPPLPFSATANVVRVDSAARNEYYSDYQWQVWSYSSCSGISMEMVINAYGHHYIAADFLQKESDLGVWDVYDGLTGGEPAIAQTAAYYGFKALPNPPRTLQALIDTVNKGYPVIVGNPGHIMVVRGGNNNYIYVADSSPANRTTMTHADFLSWWDGFSVVLVPR
ncbi:MAG TPA: C39 family peptidase [Ktedonobacteraceae bacterium]|nr:C39 family peptidase [Ktedonobacteraceae bacterium]